LLRIPRQVARAKSINKALLVDNEVDLVFARGVIRFHFAGNPQWPERGLPSPPQQPHTGQVGFHHIPWKAL